MPTKGSFARVVRWGSSLAATVVHTVTQEQENQLITAALMRHVLPRLGQPVVRTHDSCLSRESRAMQRSCATVIVCSVCVCVFF